MILEWHGGVIGLILHYADFGYTGMIDKLYHGARIALAFNMPDNGQLPQHDLLTGQEWDEILVYCRTLSPHVVCLSDYLQMILRY